MNRRDKDKLDSLLLRLTAEFSEKRRQSTTIWRGEARAIVAAIRKIATGGTRSERTSARVAKIAAKVLAMDAKRGVVQVILLDGKREIRRVHPDVSWTDVRSLAASCLTQSPDKPKRPVVKRRAL